MIASSRNPSSPRTNTKLRARLNDRQLVAKTLTSTKCNVVRLDPYNAELQLVYSYLVEFAGHLQSLGGMEMATAQAVSQVLDGCDSLDRPLYEVATNTTHTFSKNGMSVRSFVIIRLPSL